jgi:hypothetical protein
MAHVRRSQQLIPNSRLHRVQLRRQQQLKGRGYRHCEWIELGPGLEVFTTTPGDWDSDTFCNTGSMHYALPPPSLSSDAYWPLTEGQAGTYSGHVVLDQAGQWTIRYHFNHNCYDVLPDSPHGHAAYHITVP